MHANAQTPFAAGLHQVDVQLKEAHVRAVGGRGRRRMTVW